MARWWIILLSAYCLNSISFGRNESLHLQSVKPLVTALEQQLQVEMERNLLMKKRLATLSESDESNETSLASLTDKERLERAWTALTIQRVEASSLDLTIKAAQIEAESTQLNLDAWYRQLGSSRHLSLSMQDQTVLQEHLKLLELQQKRIKGLQNTRDTLSKVVKLTEERYKQINAQMHSTAKHYQSTLHTLVKQLGDIQQAWMQELLVFNERIMDKNMKLSDLIGWLKMVVIEQKDNLLYIQLELEKIDGQLRYLSELLSYKPSLMVLNTLQKPLEGMVSQLILIKELLQERLHFLGEGIKPIQHKQTSFSATERTELEAVLTEFANCSSHYQERLQGIDVLLEETNRTQKLLTEQLHTYLSSREDLPGFDYLAWSTILKQFKDMPRFFSHQILSLYNLVVSTIKRSSWLQCGLGSIVVLLWLRVIVSIKRLKKTKWLQFFSLESQIPTASTFWLTLLNRNVYNLTLGLSIGSLAFVFKVSLHSLWNVFVLIAINLAFSIAIQTLSFWLVDTISQEEQPRSKNIYLRLYSLLSVGRVITLFTLVVHQSVPDYEVRSLVARLFMLFVLTISLVSFRIRTILPKLLEDYWAKRPRYLKQGGRWFSFLVPSALLLNAMLGLIGYVQLAWVIVGYQSILLLALFIYLFFKGLLNELFDWLSEQSIKNLRNGWLWSEALLKPISQLLKLFASIAIVALLFHFAGWRAELQTFLTYFARWFSKPLINTIAIPIDSKKLVQAVVMMILTAWITRWSREFAYRWVFANLKDLGLRNSLSILTQYIAILLSILVTLRVMGITLSVVQYVLSVFAIGLGFGLRDLLNNFVTGILLLVERPLKVGDWVTIGSYDGQVLNIGVRSVTVKTEDQQELMVPNADLFYKQFVNWTRHDPIVRVTLPLSVSRDDDPARVRELILEVVGSIKKVLKSPSPQVYFRATDQMLLTFRIEYYVDLTQITSRAEINSQFLFALWKQFLEKNITPPKVVHEVQVNQIAPATQLNQPEVGST